VTSRQRTSTGNHARIICELQQKDFGKQIRSQIISHLVTIKVNLRSQFFPENNFWRRKTTHRKVSII